MRYLITAMLLALICIACLGAPGSREARAASSARKAVPGLSQNAVPCGPINLDPATVSTKRLGAIYTLSLVKIADAKPIQYVWLLKKFADQKGISVEDDETAYTSLNAPLLRDCVSHLPAGSRICCTTAYLPGSDPAVRAGIDSYPGFQDFVALCRRKNVEFVHGVPF